MNPLLSELQSNDLTEQFAEYSDFELQSNLLKLVQLNIAYLYCEALIIDEAEEELILELLDYCADKSQSLLTKKLPFELLIQLKQAKDEINCSTWTRQQIIEGILNLIIDNTLLHSSLQKFAYS